MSYRSGEKLDDSKKNFCNFHDSYLRQYIQQADTKAAWLFAASSATIIWLASKPEYLGVSKPFRLCDVNLFYVMSMIMLTLSSFFAFNVIRPRLIKEKNKGIIYFGSVAKYYDNLDYIEEINKYSEKDIFHARLSSQYYMSVICNKKYINLRLGVYSALLGFFISAILHIYYTHF